MTVYISGEGNTDRAVYPIIMMKVKDIPYINLEWVEKDELKKMPSHPKIGEKITAHHKYIKALATHSLIKNSKYIAYHRDADGKYSEVYNAIESDFKPLREKSNFKCLAIVPKEMLESWLLADVKAINSLGNGTVHVNESPLPETICNPKDYLEQDFVKLKIDNITAAYTQIAENTDIEVLKRRCPKSFGQFYTDMQSFITEEPAP